MERSAQVATGCPSPDLIVPQRPDDSVLMRCAPDRSGGYRASEPPQLAVFVGDADGYHEQRLPLAGRTERDGQFLRFTPAFGFVEGQDYVVRTRCGASRDRLVQFRVLAGAPLPPAVVTDVYPSGAVLPENVLRFYVHFSVPMLPHRAADHITLHDEFGNVDRLAFMRFKQELWNADRTRLTVLVDPSRIKRNVAPGIERPAALVAGRRYSLTIDGGWPSADGATTLPRYSKRFSVSGALRTKPGPASWRWRAPHPGTREVLTISFDRPLDRHLITNAIDLVDRDGRTISGSSHVGEHELSWSFVPDSPWPAGQPQVTVSDLLEDVAGNNVREVLDRELRVQQHLQ